MRQMGMDSVRHHYQRLRETPFSSDTKFMSVTVTTRDKPGPEVIFVKGATEKILTQCSRWAER